MVYKDVSVETGVTAFFSETTTGTERATFGLLKMAPSALMTASSTNKAGLRDFDDIYHYNGACLSLPGFFTFYVFPFSIFPSVLVFPTLVMALGGRKMTFFDVFDKKNAKKFG